MSKVWKTMRPKMHYKISSKMEQVKWSKLIICSKICERCQQSRVIFCWPIDVLHSGIYMLHRQAKWVYLYFFWIFHPKVMVWVFGASQNWSKILVISIFNRNQFAWKFQPNRRLLWRTQQSIYKLVMKSEITNKCVHLWCWNLRWKASVFQMAALAVDIISTNSYCGFDWCISVYVLSFLLHFYFFLFNMTNTQFKIRQGNENEKPFGTNEYI